MREPCNFLLVEDNADDVVLVEYAFKEAGAPHRLHAVGDGQQAMDYMMGKGAYADRKEYPLPSVILLDIKMPRVSGFEFLEWLHREAPEDLRLIPVIVMSSSNDERDVKKAYQLGANCYLIKPIPWSEFKEQLKALNIFWGEYVQTPTVKA